MSLILGEHPLELAPTLERDLYVPWLDRRDRSMLPQLGPRPSLSVVAQSLADATLNPTIASAVRREWAIGLALDPQAYLVQVDPELRAQGFERLAFDLPLDFAPSLRPLDQEAARAYAVSTLDLEIEAQATLLITPSHIRRSPAESLVTLNDVAIIREAANYFAEEALAEPAPADIWHRRRQLFAGLTLDLSILVDPQLRAQLVDQYAALPVQGFWVRISGLRDSASPRAVRGASDFVFELRGRSQKPVVIVGAGNLSLGLCAFGTSACFGIGWNEYFTFPPARQAAADGTDATGFTTVIYQPGLLRNVMTNGAARAKARRAFWMLRCACGNHEETTPPGSGERRPHTLACRLSQFGVLLGHDVPDRWPILERWVTDAEIAAARLGYAGSIYASWRAVPPAEELGELVSGQH